MHAVASALRRPAWHIALFLVFLTAAILLPIHAGARVYRHRAERLVRQLKSLRVGQTSAAEVMRLRSHYTNSDEGKCTSEECSFWIGVDSWAHSLMGWSFERHKHIFSLSFFLRDHLHWAGFRMDSMVVHVLVQKGTVVGVWAKAEFDEGPVRTIVARFSGPEETFAPYSLRRFRTAPASIRHPGLHLYCCGRGMLTGKEIGATFTAQARPQEYEQAIDFHFGCTITMQGCTLREIMPGVWQELEELNWPFNLFGIEPPANGGMSILHR